jgi:hypothetical protein
MNTNPEFTVPEHYSDVFGMGQALAYHPATNGNRWVSAIFGLIFLGAGVGLPILGYFYALDQSQRFGPVVFENNFWPFVIMGGIGLLIGIGLAINAFVNWKKGVVVYEKGLAYYALKGGLKTWKWEDIDKLFSSITKHYTNGIYTGTTYIYTLQKNDGEKLVLNNSLTKIEQLGNTVTQNAAPIQYERLIAAIKARQTVTLGPISISSDALGIGKKTYPWGEIEKFTIQSGYVNIKKKGGGWFSGASAAASAIPNLNALLAVINQIIGVN